ncbi:hypothetical protein FACS1894219_06850 [Clostridia bacterium]|nr:hypothetical protein FACS1894219_06850 [Clostridia bacterium]
MDKIKLALLSAIVFLTFTSCAVTDVDYSYSIKDALKIRAYVLEETVPDDFIWNFTLPPDEDGSFQYDMHEDIVSFETLKLNKPRRMAPFGYKGYNINIYFEFDGIIEVVNDDELVLIGYDSKNPDVGWEMKSPLVYDDVKWPHKLCVNFTPMYKEDGYPEVITDVRGNVKKGKEYYLDVNAYSFENEVNPVIKARLKLEAADDPEYLTEIDWQNAHKTKAEAKKWSRFMSVEIVSYEYSDARKLMDDIVDEEE